MHVIIKLAAGIDLIKSVHRLFRHTSRSTVSRSILVPINSLTSFFSYIFFFLTYLPRSNTVTPYNVRLLTFQSAMKNNSSAKTNDPRTLRNLPFNYAPNDSVVLTSTDPLGKHSARKKRRYSIF